ncbi:MAG: YHYH domain-containing protein [Acutalibacteraceae bacterium]
MYNIIRKIASFATITIIAILFSCPVYAHPGRTDSNGGHYDLSTGEYHYHTGEYAGRNQSGSNSANDNEYHFLTENSEEVESFYNYDKKEGLKRLCIDTAYCQYYNNGFSDALKEYLKIHPLFSLVAKNDKRDILYCDYHLSDSEYISNQENSFNELYNKNHYYSNESVLINSFNLGYNYSYSNEKYDNAPSYYKFSTESKGAREKGYDDGYNRFFDGNLYAYKENYPIESFFTTLSINAIICISITIIIVALIIALTIMKRRKNNRREYLSDEVDVKKDINVEKAKESEIEARNTIPLKSDDFSQISTKNVSLLPKFEPDCKGNNRHIDFIVGKDISEGIYYFSPKEYYKPAFFKSGGNCTNITHKRQRFFLTKGEEIQLVNCFFESEE